MRLAARTHLDRLALSTTRYRSIAPSFDLHPIGRDGAMRGDGEVGVCLLVGEGQT
jgi:hypothetical protein